MSLTKVWRDLTAKKIRTLLVVLSIAVGVMAISTVFGTKDALLPQMESGYAASNPSDISIFTEVVSPELIADLAQLSAIETAQAGMRFNSRWQIDGEWQRLNIDASQNVNDRSIRKIPLTEGVAPHGGELVMEHLVVDIADVAPGDTIVVQTATGEQTLKISGFVYDPNQTSPKIQGGAAAYIDFETAVTHFGQENPNLIYLTLHDKEQIEQVAEEVQQYLAAQNIPVLSVSKRDITVFPGGEPLSALLTLMGGIGILALLLSAFLVINTITTILASEVPNIGTMKAIGATRWMVAQVYLITILGYCIVGSIIGIVLGLIGLNLLTGYIAQIGNIAIDGIIVPPIAIILGIIAGIVIPLLAAIPPIWGATGITVREAINTYGLGGEIGRIEQALAKINRLPYIVSLSLRNVFRSKLRALLTIIALSLAGVTFIAVQATSQSLTNTLGVIFDTFDGDISYSFTLPASREEMRELIELEEGVDVAESWLWVSADIPGEEDRVRILGLDADTQIYAHEDILVMGRWLETGDTDAIVVAEKFAQDSGYGIGDRLQTEMRTGTAEWEIVGIVSDFNSGGRQLLASYEQLAEARQLPGLVNSVFVRLKDRSPEAIEAFSERLIQHGADQGLQLNINKLAENAEQSRQQFKIIITFLSLMVVLVTVVGAIGLLGTLSINVTERIKEIGVMRSVGADSRAITQVFWLEGVLLGIISWMVSIVLGYPIARAFTNIISDMLLPVSFEFPLLSLLLLGGGMIVVTTVASVFPALNAARARVADIIRYA